VTGPAAAPREPTPLRGARLALAAAWLAGVTALHLAVRLFGLALVP
jgi:hypothetical protein